MTTGNKGTLLTNTLEAAELPATIMDIIADCVRVDGVDPDIPAACALATIGAALGKGLLLANPDGKRTAPNTFFWVGADSGTGKSTVGAKISKPIVEAEAQGVARFLERDLPRAKAEKDLLEAKRKRLLGGKVEGENRAADLVEVQSQIDLLERGMQVPRLMADDTTVQELARLLARDEQLFQYSADARDVFLMICGRHNNANADDGIHLKGFSSDLILVDRVGRVPLAIQSPCLSCLLLITPDAIKELYLNKRLLQGGLLPRVFVVQSETRPRLIPECQPKPDPDAWRRWEIAVAGLLPTYRRAMSPAVIRAEPEADEIFRVLHNDSNRGLHGPVDIFTTRNAELARRLSLSLHALKHGDAACRVPLEQATAASASILVSEWLAPERRAAVEVGRRLQDDNLAERLRDILDRSGGAISVRDLQQRHGFRGDQMLDLEEFVARIGEFTWLATKPDGKGRPGRVLTHAS